MPDSMTETTPALADEPAKTPKKTSWALLALLFIAVAVLSYRYFAGQNDSSNALQLYGIKVVSDRPVGEYTGRIQSKGIALLQPESRGAVTCSLGMTAALTREENGYKITMEKGDQGIYLYNAGGIIKGMTERELVTACNAFNCIANNITCPDNLGSIAGAFTNPDEMNIILDESSGGAGGRAYIELLGVMSYMQAERADVNKDGVLSQFEITNITGNFIAIRPYLMNGSVCRPQPLHNLIETFEPDANLTVECQSMESAIYVLNSSDNRVKVEGTNVYIYGDQDHVYDGAIIVRDSLSSSWVRVLFQANDSSMPW
ncbi:MAG: hypothetical protein PHG85_05540 [Candidatus Altiarchaeota archaeon]|nr:hypothetical protein [Candidatus Altiarchaeota archaeon]